jgi:hypothetical protein
MALVVVSTTTTVSGPRVATYAGVASGWIATPIGVPASVTVAVTLFVAVSITDRLLASVPPLAT